MVKIAWKVINGYGPYAYLQRAVKKGGTVVSEHIAYLGKTVKPGDVIVHNGQKVLVPAVPGEQIDKIKSIKVKTEIKQLSDTVSAAAGIPQLDTSSPFIGAGDEDQLETAAAKGAGNLKAAAAAVAKTKKTAKGKKAVAIAAEQLQGKAPSTPGEEIKAGEYKKPDGTPILAETKVKVLEFAANRNKDQLVDAATTLMAMSTSESEKAAIGVILADLMSKISPATGEVAPKPAGKKVQLSHVPKDPDGKRLISAVHVKVLEAAAEDGVEMLEKMGAVLQEKIPAGAKRAAIDNAVAELKAQLTGSPIMETKDESDLDDTVAAVASGALKTPALKSLSARALRRIEQEAKANKKKDYDKDLEQVSGKKGSNEGGLFKDTNLQTLHYMKWPSNDRRAKLEALAATLYMMAGVPVPTVTTVKFGGKTAVKSDWIDDVAPMTLEEMSKNAHVRRNFAVDAWLANWDVIGLTADNVVKGPNNRAYRIDLGGSLIFRAQGASKPFTPAVAELDSMRNPAVAKQAGLVFKDLSAAELKAGARAVAAITDQQIDAAVDLAGIKHTAESSQETKDLNQHLKQRLKQRRDYIAEEVLGKVSPKKTQRASEVRKLTGLKLETVKKVMTKADVLTDSSAGDIRHNAFRSAMEAEFGVKEGQSLAAAIEDLWKSWKGVTTTAKGNVLRSASAAAKGQKGAGEKAMKAFWKFLEKKAGKPGVAKAYEQGYLEELAKHPKAVAAARASSRVNAALMAAQRSPSTKLNKATTVTVYRGWKADQVAFLGWDKKKPGDELVVGAPMIFSYSFKPTTAKGFAHGSQITRAEIPIDSIIATDRLNSGKASSSHEGEVIWVGPNVPQELVTKF